MKSYFKVVTSEGLNHMFFFEEKIPESVESAFAEANTLNGKISIFRPTPMPGAWDRVPVVGHRTRGAILADIGRTKDDEKLFWLKEELQAADRTFYEAGRDVLPLSAVAA